MKNINKTYFLILIFILCTGCSNNEKKIISEKFDEEDNTYEKSMEIIDEKQVSTVIDIINNSEWKNKNQESFGSVKYKIYFAYIDPEKDMKSSYYLVYLNSHEQITLVQNDKKYTKLSIENSNIIYNILQKNE